MAFKPLELAANSAGVCGVLGVVAAIIIIRKVFQSPNLDAFPTIGSSTWLGSWWDSFKYLTNAQSIIREGYEKYKSAPFKIAGPDCWRVVFSDRKHLEEVVKASEDDLSFLEAINDQIQFEHTMGPAVHYNPYHIAVIRTRLTRNIDVLYPEIRDEILASFSESLDLKGNEWKSVPALSTIQKVVCRTSNRVFVGLPLCRNHDWIDLNIQYAIDAIITGILIGLLPKFMKPLAIRLFTKVRRNIRRGVNLIGPIIEERQRCLNEYGRNWEGKPNDLLSWLLEVAEGTESTAESLTVRVLFVNFAAILSSSNSFTEALFRLAANPQYVQPLRDEVEGIVEKEGWSKSALAKMRKIDSFLKECQRFEGMNMATLTRKAMKDFTFSDGTFIPKGTSIVAATQSLHHDAKFYDNPEVFEPFRFADIDEDEKYHKYSFASTATEYLPFGHGKHACPGRFFAANELKSMLAHVVVTYDVKLEDDATHPRSLHIGTFISVNPYAKVVFRNRVD